MKIKLISGATTFEAGVNTIKKIDVNNLEMDNIVVVPDSFSMQAESLIFDTLGIKSTFNIEVVGISRLASKILQREGIAYQRISGLEEVFTIYKAVKECEDKFLYFKKCNVDFCAKILQIIKQFKSCKIKPNWLNKVGDELLDNKIHDLKLIYETYERLLGDKLDLSKFLDFFIENVKNGIDLSKINLFFVNFDSFSLEINSFICQIANLVNSMFIGISKPVSLGNAFIYENDIYNKTKQLAEKFSVTIEEEKNSTNLSKERLALIKNLYSFKIEPYNSDYFLNVLAKNRQDEIEYVAKYIKYEVVNGARFKDFAIAVADKKYFDDLKDIFTYYGITIYCDDEVNLSQTVLGRFLLKTIEISKLGFDKQKLTYIISSPLILNENVKEIIEQIDYFCIDDENEFLEKFPKYNNIISKIKDISKCVTLNQYCDCLSVIVSLVHDGHEKLLNEMDKETFYKKQSENKQAEELILILLDKLKALGQNENMILTDFENLLLFALKSVKVETIPSYIDAVYVGDVTESYFDDVKNLFVLGATANSLPKKTNDIGIIDDSDIEKLKLNFNLEPEIKVLNRRNRLKLFEVLQHAREKLIVTLPMNEDGRQSQRADFLIDLIEIFGKNIIRTTALTDFNIGIFDENETLSRILMAIGCENNLLDFYTKNRTRIPKEFVSTIKSVIKNEIPIIEKKNYVKGNILNKKKISASQLENYFDCPFKHFIKFGLSINEKQNIQPNKRLFGNFQHELLRKFVDVNKDLGKFTDKEIENFLNDNLNIIANKIYDKKVLQKKSFTKYLRNEAKIILKKVVNEQKFSEFRPKYLEKYILEDFIDDIKFEGKADRVDFCDKYFRIIDYKTGHNGTVLTDLYYGTKLQLLLYADFMKRKTGLDVAGVYYFDCQTKYSKIGQNGKTLIGLTLKDNEIVQKSDNRLCNRSFKSDILGMTGKNTDQSGFSYQYGNPIESFEKYLKYAEDVSTLAIKEIKEGFIEDKPFKGSCDRCPYGAICRHQNDFRIAYKQKKEES